MTSNVEGGGALMLCDTFFYKKKYSWRFDDIGGVRGSKNVLHQDVAYKIALISSKLCRCAFKLKLTLE